jgi:hypothetical protein
VRIEPLIRKRGINKLWSDAGVECRNSDSRIAPDIISKLIFCEPRGHHFVPSPIKREKEIRSGRAIQIEATRTVPSELNHFLNLSRNANLAIRGMNP